MNINEIANIANNMNKSDYNKSMIYRYFRESLDNNGQFDETGMAALYAYFTPNTPAKPKTDEQWIALALADKKDPRYYLHYIYSDGKRIMATDGHRLHIVNKSIEQGFYDKNMVKVEVDAKFPDVDRVIPEESNKHMFFSEATLRDFEFEGKLKPYYLINDVAIDSKYLKQACAGFSDPVIQYRDKLSSILINDGDKTAVVMPMRV